MFLKARRWAAAAEVRAAGGAGSELEVCVLRGEGAAEECVVGGLLLLVLLLYL
jgi:hypothetical protein